MPRSGGVFYVPTGWFVCGKFFLEMWELLIGNAANSSIFIPVFHRILDFKNGAEFLFWPLFFLITDCTDLYCLERSFFF